MFFEHLGTLWLTGVPRVRLLFRHRSFPRTLSVDVSCFMQSRNREDVAKIIFDKYNEVYGTPTVVTNPPPSPSPRVYV